MGAIVIRTLFRGIAVILAVLLAIFLVGYVIGDPARLALPLGASHEEYLRMRQALGLNQSFLGLFAHFWHQVFTLNFGDSFWQHTPALPIALAHLPATLVLIGAGFLIAFIGGSALGVAAAMRRGGWIDHLISTLNTVAAATPNFWLGIILILLLAVKVHAFPTSGQAGLRSLVLPALTLSLASLGRISQAVRAALLAEQGRPYARLARAKGLSPWRILGVHTARNAGIAISTFSLWELVRLITGAGVIVEVVFAWPGIGQLAIQAVQHQDFPLVLSCVLVVAVLVVLVGLAADLLHATLDPRLRVSERAEAV